MARKRKRRGLRGLAGALPGLMGIKDIKSSPWLSILGGVAAMTGAGFALGRAGVLQGRWSTLVAGVGGAALAVAVGALKVVNKSSAGTAAATSLALAAFTTALREISPLVSGGSTASVSSNTGNMAGASIEQLGAPGIESLSGLAGASVEQLSGPVSLMGF